MTEKFIELVASDNEDKMIAFLKSLSPDDKKLLITQIKKSAKEYNEYGEVKKGLLGSTYGHVHGTNSQRDLIQLATFVCFNRTDYEKSPGAIQMLSIGKLNRVIDWYHPSWFSDYINKLAISGNSWFNLNYGEIVELTDRGFLRPGKELIVRTLPQSIYRINPDRKWEYDPGTVLTHPISLREHIWYLFELESNLHFSDRWLNMGNDEEVQSGWITLFKTLTSDGRLPRFRVLQESLVASNRNFNKVLSGWFAQLFIELAPTIPELLQLQKELLSILSAPTSRPVNAALQALKKVVDERDFEAGIFLDTIPLLLSSDTKSVVGSSLMIMDKLAQKQAALRERITLMACQCFISPDEEIQSRAAKLIGKFGKPEDAALRQEISAFQQSMRSGVRQLLTAYIETAAKHQESEVPAEVPPQAFAGLTVIPFPGTIDDLVFLASQAFDNNEPWRFDLLPAALIQFTPRLNADKIGLLEPAFQRALKTIKELPSSAGRLDHLLALFFIDYGNLLVRKFPASAAGISQVYRQFDGKDKNVRTSFLVSPSGSTYTGEFTFDRAVSAYEPYKEILLATLATIQLGSDTPLLSTPTHAPCWISADVLITRLHRHQNTGLEPNSMDLQIAISRCYCTDRAAAIELAERQLSGELRRLFHFLLDEKAKPVAPFQNKPAWMVASLTRENKAEWPDFESFSYNKTPLSNYTGAIKWESRVHSYMQKQYDYALKKNIEVPQTTKRLILTRDTFTPENSLVEKFFSKFLPAAKDDPPMLYEFLRFRPKYSWVEHNDVKRIMALTPHNPAPILAETIETSMKHAEFYEAGNRKLVTAVAQFLYEAGAPPGDMTNLFLGTCMLSADKTVLNTAGEIWVKEVSRGTIDNDMVGEVIGRHESIEFAPLKRFTDLVTQNLFKISPFHDRALQVMIERVLVNLPDEPIKNLKKLLEIYGELIATNQSKIGNVDVTNKLEHWRNKGDLGKIIARIFKTQG